MSKLTWDQTGERYYETGVSNCVLYVQNETGAYPKGVAWNGVTAITESPSGAESNPQYADNIKYLDLISAEEFGATIEAFGSPVEFDVCDGTAELAPGVFVGQQNRKAFGLCYKTILGNDTNGNDNGYKLHFIYGAKAAPTERGYTTISDSPEPITLSWEITTTPVAVAGFKPTATLTVDSTKVEETKLNALLDVVYGSDDKEASLPLPDAILTIIR